MKPQSLTGFRDVLPEEQPYWRTIEKKISEITQLYGYQRIDPPILEETTLFLRGVGTTTDIVEKEMYTFTDKGDKSVTLRPEFTAGVMRLYIENGMHTRPKPVKLYCVGSIFRYERPQAGRFRQHNQFNVEALGEQDPAIDVEIMSIAWQLYAELGFTGLQFQLNSTGCPECRPAYMKVLGTYYQGHYDVICTDCKRRLEQNPLRLLDCKNESCQPVIAGAPVITNHLCTDCKEHFIALRKYLELLQRPYVINHKLVRGLDYYTKTVFEVWAHGIGSQNAMCGGGRYDGLVKQLGGPPTPGIGFGSGIERIIMSMKEQGLEPDPVPDIQVFVVHSGEIAQEPAVQLTFALRAEKVRTLLSFGQRSFKSQMREANRSGAGYVVILGEDEVSQNMASIKDFSTGDQKAVPLGDVIAVLKEQIWK